MMIDARLIDCNGKPEYEENFNRLLALVDVLYNMAKCSVTFDSDGGTAVSDQLVNYNGKATEPTDPTKEGKTFGGWLNGTAAYDFNAAVTDNIKLKAEWS